MHSSTPTAIRSNEFGTHSSRLYGGSHSPMFHVPAQMSSDYAQSFRAPLTRVCPLSPFTEFSRCGFSFSRRAATAALWCVLSSLGCDGEPHAHIRGACPE